MSHRRDYVGEYYADRMNVIYQVIEEGEISEMRDGHSFSYPSCTLKQVDGDKVITVGKSYIDNILARTVMPKVSDNPLEALKDALNEFSNALGLANQNKYFDDKEVQHRMQQAADVLSHSYLDRGFRKEEDDIFCRKQTKKFLKEYTTYILSHMEIVAKMREMEAKK